MFSGGIPTPKRVSRGYRLIFWGSRCRLEAARSVLCGNLGGMRMPCAVLTPLGLFHGLFARPQRYRNIKTRLSGIRGEIQPSWAFLDWEARAASRSLWVFYLRKRLRALCRKNLGQKRRFPRFQALLGNRNSGLGGARLPRPLWAFNYECVRMFCDV